MLMQILSRTPVYVWAVLAGLMALGLLQSRTRRVTLAQAGTLPLVLLGLGLWSMAPAFAVQPLLMLAWLSAVSLGAWAGRQTPQAPGTHWLAAEGRFVLPGSWIPLAFILFIFLLRYAVSVGSAMHPQWRGDLSVQLPLALVFGSVSGLSAGRVLGLLRVMKAATIRAHA